MEMKTETCSISIFGPAGFSGSAVSGGSRPGLCCARKGRRNLDTVVEESDPEIDGSCDDGEPSFCDEGVHGSPCLFLRLT